MLHKAFSISPTDRYSHIEDLEHLRPVWQASLTLVRAVFFSAIHEGKAFKIYDRSFRPPERVSNKKGAFRFIQSREIDEVIIPNDKSGPWILQGEREQGPYHVFGTLTFRCERDPDEFVSIVLADPAFDDALEIVIAETFRRGLRDECLARLDAGLNPNMVVPWGGRERSLMSFAAESNNHHVVKALRKHGARIPLAPKSERDQVRRLLDFVE